ncbi:MAG TPA: hypothetical protein VFE51_07470 [Verrucomicrobiae bacterium]|nr:hypothetical protein [Verrucomicrobiae bacterium]
MSRATNETIVHLSGSVPPALRAGTSQRDVIYQMVVIVKPGLRLALFQAARHYHYRMQRLLSFWFALIGLACLWPAQLLGADAEVCAVCGRPISEGYYSIEDKVTLEKRHICKECERSFPFCFVCGLPADTNAPGFVQLPDQRVLCARDAITAVLREDEGVRICNEVHDEMERLFSRYMVFPQTNVTVEVMDRVKLQGLFKLLGNDYHCPNVWGLTQTETNRSHAYRISLMSALPLRWFQATCAHEYGHTWVGEHVAASRRKQLDPDAEEGFCELLSFLLMESFNDEAQKAMILRNPYTRGQVDLFVAAERTYGFNEVLDWMQFGLDSKLDAEEPGRLRKLAPAPNRSLALTPEGLRWGQSPVPETLVLRAIFWDEKHPRAVINDQLFTPNDQARVRVGKTNLLVRCLQISAEAVRLRVVDTGQEQTLWVK